MTSWRCPPGHTIVAAGGKAQKEKEADSEENGRKDKFKSTATAGEEKPGG
jgi:hypothetical protein